MSDSPESRRAERKAVEPPATVEDVISGQVIGRIGNLSRTGLMLICNRQLGDDALYQLRFSLPAREGVAACTLEVGVHEQWTQQAADHTQHWSGVRIIDIGPKAEAQLVEWLG